jgi:hypothetical protein
MLVAGGVLLVLPGPGLLVLPAAIEVLGSEFETARKLRGPLRAGVARLGRGTRRAGRLARVYASRLSSATRSAARRN